MLKTALCRSIPASHAFMPVVSVVAASRRTFMRNAPGMMPALTSKPIDSKSTLGTETPHKSMSRCILPCLI